MPEVQSVAYASAERAGGGRERVAPSPAAAAPRTSESAPAKTPASRRRQAGHTSSNPERNTRRRHDAKRNTQ